MFNFNIWGQGLAKAFSPVQIVKDIQTLGTWGRVFIPLCCTLMLFLSYQWGSSWWQILMTLSGVFCVVLVAERKMTNYAWGLVNCSLYGLMSYQNGIYGDATLNWLIYIPFQFLGIYGWMSGSDNEGEVISRKLGFMGAIGWLVVFGIATYGLDHILTVVKGKHTIFDATNVVLSLIATVLMYYRYREQWVCWILVNLSGIALWKMNIDTSGEGYSSLAMWVFFLANSIFGLCVWSWATLPIDKQDDIKRRVGRILH